MKKLLIFAMCLLVTSCAVENNILPSNELVNWHSNHDTLFYKGKPTAVFTGYEFEIYKGELTREICLQHIDDDVASIDSIIFYVHTMHRNDKVQVISTYGRK